LAIFRPLAGTHRQQSREDYAERFPDLKGRFFAALASR
jgi:hypothetical protein